MQQVTEKEENYRLNPIFSFSYIQIIFVIFLAIGILLVTLPFKTSKEDLIVYVVFGSFLILSFLGAEIWTFIQIRHYGFFYMSMGIHDPIREEPLLLIRIRDFRAKKRKECLLELINSWNQLKLSGDFNESLFLKRIIYCLIDRDPGVRRLACEILHKNFRTTLEDIEYLVIKYLNSKYYLIDNKLKQAILEGGLKHLRLCQESQCFSHNPPCQTSNRQNLLENIEPTYLVNLNRFDITPDLEKGSSPILEDGQVKGICIVCNFPIYDFEPQVKCPICQSLAHRTHILEWIKIKGFCPHCMTKIKEKDFAKK